ncbi:DUF4167 domain-containing protein [Parvibaculum sp.]|uniref:DUF4167 domain-containing protein n=1 Tax=Parvibaculum sp. TaxID=2024848 RepID=UPI00320CA51A
MRQGQNNSKRSRGRGRKPQNSGNRAYDSNGPDVKIRGTAAHVCEKYQQLARDAISAGDRVMAENYYQHAEHYYRLLMASQVMNEGQPRPQHNLGYRPDEDQDEEEEDFSSDQPQPNFPNQPFHQQAHQHGQRQGRGEGRGERHQNSSGGQQPQGDLDIQPDSEQPVIAEGEARGDGHAQGIPGGVPSGEGSRRRQGRRRRPRHEAGGERPASEGGENAASSSVDEAPAV